MPKGVFSPPPNLGWRAVLCADRLSYETAPNALTGSLQPLNHLINAAAVDGFE